MQMMEMKQNKSFSPICKTKHICINNKEDKYFSPLSNENMHKLKFFSPFLSIINKGFKVKSNQTNFLPLFVKNKEIKKG